MIKEMIEYLVSLGQDNKRPDALEVSGKQFLLNPSDWKEIQEDTSFMRAFRDHSNRPLRIGTITGLIDFVRAHCDKICQILVSPTGCRAYFDIDQEARSSTWRETQLVVEVPFASVPKVQEFDFVKFQDWMGQHGTNILNFDKLSQAVRLFKTEERNTVTVKENGPVITLSVAASKDCEGNDMPIPKEIDVNLPTGTREFEIINTFLLRIEVNHGAPKFTLTKKINDGSWDRLVEMALDKLKDAELPNTLLLEGAE